MGRIVKTKPLCIIPARGNSKRLPRKNVRLFRGKPLIAYTIKAALESKVFDRVCVSSEDDEILSIARKYGADFIHKRPRKLSSDTAQVRDVCAFLLNEFSAAENTDYRDFCVLLPCSPFRTKQDIVKAYKVFKKEDANVLLTLVPFSHPVQRAVCVPNKYIKPFMGLKYMKQAQKLDPCYRHDGSIIFAKNKAFLRKKEFYIDKAVPYFMPPERSVDIDNLLDLKWAEFLAEWQEKQKRRGK